MWCLIFYRIGKEAAKRGLPVRYAPEKKKQLTAPIGSALHAQHDNPADTFVDLSAEGLNL
jgi:hypothetical protein